MRLLTRLRTAWTRWRRDDSVSPEWWSHHDRIASTRGWDGPVWRTPKEIRKMRAAERRAALRRVS